MVTNLYSWDYIMPHRSQGQLKMKPKKDKNEISVNIEEILTAPSEVILLGDFNAKALES